MSTFFKNSICKIKTNLRIDLAKFTRYFGGQLTPSLPANRNVFHLNNNRYVILIYRTGNIMLTNLYYFDQIEIIFDFVNSMLIYCVMNNVAKIDYNEDDGSDARKIRVEYLIENLHFSIQLHSFFFNSNNQEKKERKQLFESIVTNLDRFIRISNIKKYLYENLPRSDYREISEKLDTIEESVYHLLRKNKYLDQTYLEYLFFNYGESYKIKEITEIFPANILKYIYLRTNINRDLWATYKSDASKKRHKDDQFKYQKVSLHCFENGKLIITGCQTKEDFSNIIFIIEKLVEYYTMNKYLS